MKETKLVKKLRRNTRRETCPRRSSPSRYDPDASCLPIGKETKTEGVGRTRRNQEATAQIVIKILGTKIRIFFAWCINLVRRKRGNEPSHWHRAQIHFTSSKGNTELVVAREIEEIERKKLALCRSPRLLPRLISSSILMDLFSLF